MFRAPIVACCALFQFLCIYYFHSKGKQTTLANA